MGWEVAGASSAKDGSPWAVIVDQRDDLGRLAGVRGTDLYVAVGDAAGTWGRGYEAVRLAPVMICVALDRPGEPAARLAGALQAVSREIARLLPDDTFDASFGAVAAIAGPDGIHVAWAGGCGAAWLRRGTPVKVTRLRTLLDHFIASGKWAAEDAAAFPHPHVLMTVMGAGEEHQVNPDHAGPWQLEAGDELIMGSQPIVDAAAGGAATADVAERARGLIARAFERSPIERSVVVVRAT